MRLLLYLSLLGGCYGFLPHISRTSTHLTRFMTSYEGNNTKPVRFLDSSSQNANSLKYEFDESQRNIVRIPTKPEDLVEELQGDSAGKEMSYSSAKLSSYGYSTCFLAFLTKFLGRITNSSKLLRNSLRMNSWRNLLEQLPFQSKRV